MRSHAAGMPTSPLHHAVSSLTSFSVRHRGAVIAAWVVFVVACVFAGSLAGTRTLTNVQSGTGSSARGSAAEIDSGLGQPASESILVKGASAPAVARASAQLDSRFAHLPDVGRIGSPARDHALVAHGGRDELTTVALRGDVTSSVIDVQRAVAAVGVAHPSLHLYEIGDGSIERAINSGVSNDFRRAELFAIPLTLVILVGACGALAAASVPLLLGLTSVAAALGLTSVLSHLEPTSATASSVILLLGLAVGVDYSLFYMRRVREERAGGDAAQAALESTARTVSHAIVVSGCSVIVAMAGLLLTGSAVFTGFALGTMLVVAIAVLGSLTVLPAVLALLGDRIEWGRIRLRSRRREQGRAWRALAAVVTGHPRTALLSVVVVLGALSLGVLSLHTSDVGLGDVPAHSPVLIAQSEVNRAFPGGSNTAQIVISTPSSSLAGAPARAELGLLGDDAIRLTHAGGAAEVVLSRSGRVAAVMVPLPGTGIDARTLSALTIIRSRVLAQARHAFPGAQVDLTGQAAGGVDFNALMASRAPLVIGFVLVLGFLLLLAAFRSVAIAAAVLALNLLSVGAAFGVLVAIFQHTWAQGLLGFTSNGAVVSWLPLFAFAVLFGLSMDYTVLVVARILEGVRRGLPGRQAASEGVAATAGVVSSAAVVMVAVFSVFATLSALEYKQAGVGLAAAILIDATLVRGIALPAAITLITDRAGRSVRRSRREAPRTADALSSGA
jgi:uncharacterized membrane protein YdfJ with MMPL/SSD domain